jgi:hypothetical protein
VASGLITAALLIFVPWTRWRAVRVGVGIAAAVTTWVIMADRVY